MMSSHKKQFQIFFLPSAVVCIHLKGKKISKKTVFLCCVPQTKIHLSLPVVCFSSAAFIHGVQSLVATLIALYYLIKRRRYNLKKKTKTMIVIHIIYISPGVVVAIIAAAEPHPPPLPTVTCTFTRKKGKPNLQIKHLFLWERQVVFKFASDSDDMADR